MPTNIVLPVNTNEVILPFENTAISGYENTTIQSFLDPNPDILTINVSSATVVYGFTCTGQFSTPNNTISVGNWTASTGSNLAAMVDETGLLDTTDYIISGNTPYEDTVQFTMSPLQLPTDGTTTLFVWARKVA